MNSCNGYNSSLNESSEICLDKEYKNKMRNKPGLTFAMKKPDKFIISISGFKIVWLGIALLMTNFFLTSAQQRKLSANSIIGNISVDGLLDEPEWLMADSSDNFRQYFPLDSVPAKYQTSIRMLYNDHYMYVGVVAYTKGNKFIVSSLRRDFGGAASDNISLMFDTYRDGTNAFLFSVTPYGVQRDVLVSGGGETFNTTWDMKWQVESKRYDHYYVIEMAIPFNSLKFREGDSQWNFQCYRWDLQSNEQSAWSPVPRNQLFSSLAFTGKLDFEKPLGKSHTPVAIIPYVNTFTQKDFEAGKTTNQLKVGGDAKVAIGNSMNLDITVNPDFSNVEVDDVVTNLTRFEVLLPEKRQFFIDNNDLFGSFGSIYRDETPFFSRRIGLARDSNGNLIENRIIGGVRLSGKINQDWRLGLLDVQTGEDLKNGIVSNNNMMVAVQRRIFARSNIGAFIINRETTGDYDFLETRNKYNRVMGADYNLASKDNSWTGKFYLHKSLQPGDSKGNLSSQATVSYNTRKYIAIIDWVYVDEDFRSDLGFIPRKGFFKSGNGFQRHFYPKKGILSQHTIGAMALYFWNPDFKRTDHQYSLYWNSVLKDQSTLEFQANNNYVFLLHDFDPTRSLGSIPLSGNQGYYFNQVVANYQSNQAKLLTGNAQVIAGEFYNGFNTSVTGGLSFRIQPWVLTNLNMSYNLIRLPYPHPDADLWLLSPKLDITFSKSLFWSTLVQYSSQWENLGINSRLQWRFAPLSDLYLVYNDNYYTSTYAPRFRSINLKITYWLNL